MAVQTVYIPLSFKFDPYEARFNDDYRQAKGDAAVSKREEAQEQLNALLAQGYTVVTQTNVETRSGIDLAIILYKPDAPKVDQTGDDFFTGIGRMAAHRDTEEVVTKFLVDREV